MLVALLVSIATILPGQPAATAPTEVRVSTAQAGTQRLRYADWGGPGEALVLLPARCDSPFVYGDLAPLLAKHFRVVSPWTRGCPGAEPVPDEMGIDRQIADLVSFLDALGFQRATFVGHSASGGKVVRLARQFPARVSRVITLDIIYAGVPDAFEERFQAAISSALPPASPLSLDSYRRRFQAWELGAWSAALEKDFLERTERRTDGTIGFRRQHPDWQKAFAADVTAGRYHENALSHDALFIVAQDLDRRRVRQLPASEQRELLPMADAIAAARREQLAQFAKNGTRPQVAAVEGSHYLFVDRPAEVAALMISFLDRPR